MSDDAARERDERWMWRALAQADLAARRGEVPIGCVVVLGEQLLAAAHDQRELLKDPTAHAEVLAVRAAARTLGNWRLEGAEVFVTLEPCPMCAGALVQARVARLVFGAANPRWGACTPPLDIVREPRFNHQLVVVGGVLAPESAVRLRSAFRAWRIGNRPPKP